jgi:hypothetical protein
MHKTLQKMLVILGFVLIISAYTGRASPVTAITTLPPTSLVETVTSNSQATLPIMAVFGITCTDCHGELADVDYPNRTSWVNLLTYSNCFTQALTKSTTTHLDKPSQKLITSADAVFRDSNTHGDWGIYCAACHGSPHASYPTITVRGNEQSIRFQGHSRPIVECAVCHMEKLKEAFWHFGGDD